MTQRLNAWVQLVRPHEWVKNLFVFAPLIFAERLFDVGDISRAAWAFGTFCVATSVVYIVNDVLDRHSDRHHPMKQHRPLASGTIAVRDALGLASALVAVVELVTAQRGFALWLVINAYLVLGLLYSCYLKRKVIVDALTIAVGFVLRVLAGSVAIRVRLSEWLILCTFLLAVFLSFSKRRHELIQLGTSSETHRSVLAFYSAEFLDQMNLITITLTLTCYIFYTIAPETVARFGTRHLVFSVVLVMFGMFRYLFLIHKKQKGSPVEVLYADRQIVLILLLWLLYIVGCLYVIPSALRP